MHIETSRTYRMRIVLDAKCPHIIMRCARALEAIWPDKTAYLGRQPGCVEVGFNWRRGKVSCGA